MWAYNEHQFPPDELCHYGVKGMKWGVRKKRVTSGRKRKSRSMSSDAAEAAKLKKKKVSEMSNDELRRLNERRNLEENYHRLNKNAVQKGLAFVGTTAAATGSIIALYNNSNKLVKIGSSAADKIIDSVGDMVVNDLNKHFKNMRI